jgi:glutathione synthase
MVRQIRLTGEKPGWFTVEQESVVVLADFDGIVMRKDPPFDSEFFYATHMLSRPSAKAPRSSTSPPHCATTRKSSPSWSSRSFSAPRW